MFKRVVKIHEDSESLDSFAEQPSQDSTSFSTVQLISHHNVYKEEIETHIPMLDITSFEAVEPLEKDRFIRDTFSYFKNNQQDSASITELEKPLVINGVRIQPGCMIFKDAYDGKSFNQTVTLTNCGKVLVNIRILPPTSKAFKIKPTLIAHALSPGLSIVKKIQYLYTKPTAIPQACMDIFVNNECLRYELLVNTCYAQVSVTPKIIDFGEIDVCMISEVKKITITNAGTKQATYAIDLGRNPLQIIVEPMKGIVQPGESKEIIVEVFGTCAGEFNQEFWIKTEPLQRVHIQGHFIVPGLKIEYPLADKNILVLTFPKTFVGVQLDRNVVIKNHSSTSAVFCVNGRTTDDEPLPFDELSENDINFKQFRIHPVEGRLHKDQKYIMTVTYNPQKPENRPNFYICRVIVEVMKCRADGNPCRVQRRVLYELGNPAPSAYVLDTVSVSSIITTTADKPQEVILIPDDSVTILLYGEVELPNVSIHPEKLYLKGLKVYDTQTEILQIINNSKTLPLVMKFKKAPSVEMEPRTIYLPPRQPVEVLLKVRPTKMGDALAKVTLEIFFQQRNSLIKVKTIHFDVIYSGDYTEERKMSKKTKPYFLQGITPTNHNEIGYLVDDVRFNTKIEKPAVAMVEKSGLKFNKNNDALIAFPNDRPKILKPWKNVVACKTIFTQLPRLITPVDIDYDLTLEQQLLRDSTRSYYLNYIRSLSKHKYPKQTQQELEDYRTTNQKKILMEDVKSRSFCPSAFLTGKPKQRLFIPLTPYEIQNLVVTPKFIQLGRLAAESECSDHFNVQNRNKFPIHISIKALYPSITIAQGEFILGANAQRNIDFNYHSDCGGNHHIPMFVIMNFFHVIDLTVLATVVANAVKCLTKNISIVPTEKTTFLELENPINSDVSFEMDTKYFHLESFPSKGVIPAKRKMTITVTFNPEVGYTPIKEIAVISESGLKDLIEVHFERKKASVSISSDTIEFRDIPLNTEVSQELIIQNKSDQLVPINIELENSELFPELTITPMKALLWQKGDIVITFRLKLTEVIDFILPIKIIFQYEYARNVTVKGNVVYPSISFRPELIKIRKVPSGSTVSTPFKVYNNCEVSSYVLFPMEEYPEFTIKTKLGESIARGMVSLGPKEKRELLLEFHPQEAVAYCIYLPYILNGILGPPELNCAESLQGNYYLSSTSNEYKIAKSSAARKLKALKILCAASKAWIQFSSLELDFDAVDQLFQNFEATNINSATHQISLKIGSMTSFVVTSLSENILQTTEELTVTLEPAESFQISFQFIPENYGTTHHIIPVFVDSLSNSTAFNHLELIGEYPKPIMNSNVNAIYFTPTSAGLKEVKKFDIELIKHHCTKEIEVEYNESIGIEISLLGRENVCALKTVVHCMAVFSPSQDCRIETKANFCCACNTTMAIDIFACCDTSAVINFMTDGIYVDVSTYPLFPDDDDTSDYASVLRTVVCIIERWLYSQGYFYQNYYRIPSDIARYPVDLLDDIEKKGRSDKRSFPLLPLIQLLVNLMDKSILKYVESGIAPSVLLGQRTLYKYITYKNTIAFLRSQGIIVPGLKPQHLLIYPEYLEFKENLAQKYSDVDHEHFEEREFLKFSKQKWLDLFFHIYKILVLERVVNPKPVQKERRDKCNEDNEFIQQDRNDLKKYLKANIARFPSWFYCDVKLLLWLEYHYNRQKNVLWPNEHFEDIEYFKDLSDVDNSVSLVTVTAAYCPYLKEQLSDIYVFPKNIEQKVHNACTVVKSWKNLNLSFDIHPQTIVTANKVKIIFILTYLFEVLPHFYPTNEVIIEAPLSESATYHLNVQNWGNVPIQYIALFFGQNSNLFKLDSDNLTIPGGKTKALKLTYFAKKVLNASEILVLSGEVGRQRYAKSMAITITGVPKTTSSDEIKLTVGTYEFCKKKLNIKTPYGKTYQSKIFICFDEPKSYNDLHSIKFLKDNYIPREIDFLKTECEFVDKGECSLTMNTYFLSQGETRFYLYFCNDEIGDFCVLITLTSKLENTKITDINVELPQNFKKPCICRKGSSLYCPRTFTVYVPSKNKFLVESTEGLAENCFAEGTLSLVRKFYGTPVVPRILKFYLDRFPQGFMLAACIFDDQIQFSISDSKQFSTHQQSLFISDVTSEDTVPLVLHWNQGSQPKEAILELRSQNQKEIRRHRLLFPQEEGAISISNKSENISSVNQQDQ